MRREQSQTSQVHLARPQRVDDGGDFAPGARYQV